MSLREPLSTTYEVNRGSLHSFSTFPSVLITIDQTIYGLCGIFEPYCAVQYLNAREISRETLSKSEALIVRTTKKYGAETLLGTSVKFLGSVSAGFDHIDTEFCEKNEIFWTAAPGCNADSVAEYAGAALRILTGELFGEKKTLAIVGLGNVGSRVKKIAENLGMRVLVSDPPKNFNDNIFDADIITLHTPLTKSGEYSTFHLANADFFAKMKKGTWFINTARGAVCDSEALREFLKNGYLGGAITDVWENEPSIDTTLLPYLKIATPHIAGHSKSAKENANRMIINSFGKFFGIPELKNYELPPEQPVITAINEISKNSIDSQFSKTGVFRDDGEPAKNKHSNSSPKSLRESLSTTYEVNRGSLNSQKIYDICYDDRLFRQNPKNFSEYRNSYIRQYAVSPQQP